MTPKIYKINTKDGPIYMTEADRAKYQAYTRILKNYERRLVYKYGQQFNLLITPSEYNKAIFLHNQVNGLVQEIKAKQKTLKAMFNR